ncbi:MAG TPA: alpha-amylase family glycosyl hydrolase, partial [Spirochaetota bacterium]|nr:alpha-amylase family glycosyl hydrolase [Spirochaetota bacterium]
MRNLLLIVIIFLFSFNLFSNQIIEIPSNNVVKWYSTGVFYELFVRSFKDTNGDGHGDFKGVLENINYLEKLGVSAIWFMPINDSAERTNNYDPTNFMDVDPTYGTMDDFKNLLSELHKKNIKVILDLVVNHTSIKHPFFIEAMNDKNSKYRNWFLWSDTDLNEKNKKPVWHKTETGWFFGKFVNTKPDLNYDNPEVVE